MALRSNYKEHKYKVHKQVASPRFVWWRALLSIDDQSTPQSRAYATVWILWTESPSKYRLNTPDPKLKRKEHYFQTSKKDRSTNTIWILSHFGNWTWNLQPNVTTWQLFPCFCCTSLELQPKEYLLQGRYSKDSICVKLLKPQLISLEKCPETTSLLWFEFLLTGEVRVELHSGDAFRPAVTCLGL